MSIRFIPVSSTPSAEVKELYTQSFPLHERRPWPQQLLLLQQKKLQLLALRDEDAFIGFIFFWQLTDALFIEHFAIDPNNRSKGTGTHIMQHMATLAATILLETEPAGAGTDAVRRIRFYEKLGYHAFSSAYQQPPYASSYPSLQMQLMHNRMPDAKPDFEKLKAEIYNTVYGIAAE